MRDRRGKQVRETGMGPTVAPGINDEQLGENATKEDIKNGNSTKVIRLFWDENDPRSK
ncbi:MAG TPA: hypothetical protein VIO64_16510 [Pseudobacteroides sp.]|uniref:hypothetical protein n=1 Tax=Pseudobacteroides sp. TaxID=1968840 RepID=UPI002F95F50E